MTNKQQILHMVQRWPEDISLEKALYHMHVMKEVMEGLKEAEEGLGVDHDELFDDLERLCDEEENQGQVDAKGRKKSKGASPAHRGSRAPKNGQVLRKPPKKVRRPAP